MPGTGPRTGRVVEWRGGRAAEWFSRSAARWPSGSATQPFSCSAVQSAKLALKAGLPVVETPDVLGETVRAPVVVIFVPLEGR